ncbi:MAG: bifunctional DNA-formamidopyrimidine glycosylase/DNA-(apurinic or apyrimidinic site) lyase, partial [Alphaproteobacteria bacterium]|nr:bifunctional DNA-formamidopyrimidine glycosylase/DNA-(apurinic or apyrimidinic site) lyase [Alphaproteobacteria bacterium]
MPELPEVEIIKNNLSEYMIGNKFISIEVNTSKLRYKIPHNFDETIKNSKVIKIERIAKYIIIYLSNEFKILVHLGMTGNFLSSSQKINSLINNEDK